MALSTQGYKGTRDFYPEDKRLQKAIFDQLRRVVESFGYAEYDAPLIEPIEIYAAKSGDEIVNEQLYSFTDRGDRKVAIRPEMTPSLARMVAARRQELAYPLRLYSIPNLWRYERPQRGRLREHWQLNVDLFGIEGIEADHEIILVADAVMKVFNAPADSYQIRINSRKLVDDFLRNELKLNDKQKQDVAKLIDRKTKLSDPQFEAQAKELVGDNWSKLVEFLKQKTPNYPELKELLKLLSQSGVSSAVFDPGIMRGLDYYTDIVFEVYDSHPDNNRSMFGGGRYDGLVGLFGVEPLPVVGFGMGDITLQNFLELHKLLPFLRNEIDAVVILIGDVYKEAQPLLSQLRQRGLKIAVDMTDRKIDAKIKSAIKSGVPELIFIGEKELKTSTIRAKHLASGQEKTMPLGDYF